MAVERGGRTLAYIRGIQIHSPNLLYKRSSVLGGCGLTTTT